MLWAIDLWQSNSTTGQEEAIPRCFSIHRLGHHFVRRPLQCAWLVLEMHIWRKKYLPLHLMSFNDQLIRYWQFWTLVCFLDKCAAWLFIFFSFLYWLLFSFSFWECTTPHRPIPIRVNSNYVLIVFKKLLTVLYRNKIKKLAASVRTHRPLRWLWLWQ